MQLPYRVPYKIRLGIFAACFFFFGVCTIGLGYIAWKHCTGLGASPLLFGLSPEQATWIYWALAAVSAGFVIIAAYLLVVGLVKPPCLELTEDAVHLGRKTIAYGDLTQVKENIYQTPGRPETKGGVMLYAGKKKIWIARLMLPSDEVYEEIKAFLESRTRPLS